MMSTRIPLSDDTGMPVLGKKHGYIFKSLRRYIRSKGSFATSICLTSGIVMTCDTRKITFYSITAGPTRSLGYMVENGGALERVVFNLFKMIDTIDVEALDDTIVTLFRDIKLSSERMRSYGVLDGFSAATTTYNGPIYAVQTDAWWATWNRVGNNAGKWLVINREVMDGELTLAKTLL